MLRTQAKSYLGKIALGNNKKNSFMGQNNKNSQIQQKYEKPYQVASGAARGDVVSAAKYSLPQIQLNPKPKLLFHLFLATFQPFRNSS